MTTITAPHIHIIPSFTYEGEPRPDHDGWATIYCPCGHVGDTETYGTADVIHAECDSCGVTLRANT
jgi:hypothetical protein